ncbi:MAG: hypothetical protein HKN43_04600 [Rhodothermales bacterium]|nr:hypothetical protein [Rhodothermales bacterium]
MPRYRKDDGPIALAIGLGGVVVSILLLSAAVYFAFVVVPKWNEYVIFENTLVCHEYEKEYGPAEICDPYRDRYSELGLSE